MRSVRPACRRTTRRARTRRCVRSTTRYSRNAADEPSARRPPIHATAAACARQAGRRSGAESGSCSRPVPRPMAAAPSSATDHPRPSRPARSHRAALTRPARRSAIAPCTLPTAPLPGGWRRGQRATFHDLAVGGPHQSQIGVERRLHHWRRGGSVAFGHQSQQQHAAGDARAPSCEDVLPAPAPLWGTWIAPGARRRAEADDRKRQSRAERIADRATMGANRLRVTSLGFVESREPGEVNPAVARVGAAEREQPAIQAECRGRVDDIRRLGAGERPGPAGARRRRWQDRFEDP